MPEPLLATEAKTQPEATPAQGVTPPVTSPTSEKGGAQPEPSPTPKQPEPAKPQGAPETYKFETPKGMPTDYSLDEAVVDAYASVARQLNLSQKDAQLLLDSVLPTMLRRGTEQQTAQSDAWVKQAQSDREFGGSQLDANLRVAAKAIDRFGTPELRALLDSPFGLGNHPELIRFAFRVGKAISEDKFVGGQPASSRVDMNDPASMAKVLYPKSPAAT